MKAGLGPERPTDTQLFAGVRVLAVAAFDSFLRSATFYGEHLRALGAQVDYSLARVRKNQLSLRQAQAAGLDTVPPFETVAALTKAERLAPYDAVLLALDGARTRAFFSALARTYTGERTKQRPLVLTAYPGILFRFHLEGMSCRMPADLFLLNSRHDLSLYTQLRHELGLPGDNAVLGGLCAVPAFDPRPRPPSDGPIVFVGQPTVPVLAQDRLFVASRLVALAERFPAHEVLIKPRHGKAETTLHRERSHFEDLLGRLARERALPPNVRITYEPLRPLLARASLCLTVSSTAALEAIHLGVPTRIVRDVGIHENLGNHFFLGSKLIGSIDEIETLPRRDVDEHWLHQHSTSAEEAWPGVRERLALLLEARRREGAPALEAGRFAGRAESYAAFVGARFGQAALSRMAPARFEKLLALSQWLAGLGRTLLGRSSSN